MKLTESNLYLKEVKDDMFIVCIEMPDDSRNYIHSQTFILNDCLIIREELIGKTVEDDCNSPYPEKDGTYYRLKMTVESKGTFSGDIYFHSRKLNLNDVVKEYTMLIQPTENMESNV